MNQNVESWIYTDVGHWAQTKVFEQTIKILETCQPGISYSRESEWVPGMSEGSEVQWLCFALGRFHNAELI